MKLWIAPQTWTRKNAASKADALDFDKVNKIAVIKHAALGDMLLLRPMLIELKKDFPNAELTLSIVTNYQQGVPEDLVDRVHVAKGNDKKYGLSETLASYLALGQQDILFDVSATTRSFWISLLTKATLKIGFQHRGLHRLLYDIAIPRAHYRFEAETFLEQLNVLGLGINWPPQFGLPKPEWEKQRPYLVYFPTASVAYKCWPAENYAEAISRLCTELPEYEHILLIGLADWEKDYAVEIENGLERPGNFRSVQGSEQTFPLIANADMLISADTGIRNMAIAYGTPTVSIFPQLSTIFGYRPFFGNHEVVYSLKDNLPGVDDVVDRVLATVHRLDSSGS